MSDLYYNYRQHLINNTLSIQKQNTKNIIESCCYCNQCNYKTIDYVNTFKDNGIYTTEPSDLQQNYNAHFKKQSLASQLNTHKF